MSEVIVKNPATGEALYATPAPSDEQLKEMFERAKVAYEKTRAMDVRSRVREIGKLKGYILDQKEQIAQRICRETGKCRTDALLVEVYSVLDFIQYYEKHAERILGDMKVPTPLAMHPRTSRVWFEPLGPVLVIAPWNYPLVLSFQPVISAFLAGNSVLLKPSDYTPLMGLYEEMIAESGFIQDAIQVVYGAGDVGKKLIDLHPSKVFFTGSVATGRKIMAQASERLIPIELELGGKDPMLVFEDADVERAANGALWGGMVNSGQTCTSVERAYVQKSVYEDFLARLREKAGRLRTSSDVSEAVGGEADMGCMTTDFQAKVVQTHVADAVAKGARLIAGGSLAPGTRKHEPTILADVRPDMSVLKEETFGPLIAVASFDAEDEVVAMANDSEFGLSASVWTRDMFRAERVARALVTGNVSINDVLATQANSALPFGGVKDSGFGRYKGAFGLHAFCNIKSVSINKGNASSELNWYPYSKEKYAIFSELLEALFRGKRPSILRALLLRLRLTRLK